MSQPPVTIQVDRLLPDTLGLYVGSTQQFFVNHRLDSAEFSVVANGGAESCSLQLASAREQGRLWLDACGGHLRIFDRSAKRVWSGTIVSVEVNDGTKSTSLTTDGMANAIRVVYTQNGKTASVRVSTTASRARFYTRELIHSMGDANLTSATTTGNRLLGAYAWPSENTVSGLTTKPSPGEATVSIMARGWWHALGWANWEMRQSQKNGTAATQTLLNNIILQTFSSSNPNLYGNITIPAFAFLLSSFTGPTIDNGDGPSSADWPLTQGWETALESAERLTKLGDSSGRQIAYGYDLKLIHEGDPESTYCIGRTWAGAAPSTIAYYLKPPGLLLGPHMCPIPWTQARPDVMVQTLGSAVPVRKPGIADAIDSNGRYWVNRTQYRWGRGQGESLALEPAGHQDAAVILARTR